MKLSQKYLIQKHHAGKRGIDWQFTLESWIAWWGDDIVNRGRKSGQLVMARIGDIGPYHPDNCVKKTCNDNLSEGSLGKSKSLETRKRMSEFVKPPRTKEHSNNLSKSLKGKHFNKKESSRPIHTPLGNFPSIAEAKRTKSLDYHYYIKTRPTEYYYI